MLIVGAKLAADPALLAVRKEIDFYFSQPAPPAPVPPSATPQAK